MKQNETTLKHKYNKIEMKLTQMLLLLLELLLLLPLLLLLLLVSRETATEATAP